MNFANIINKVVVFAKLFNMQNSHCNNIMPAGIVIYVNHQFNLLASVTAILGDLATPKPFVPSHM